MATNSNPQRTPADILGKIRAPKPPKETPTPKLVIPHRDLRPNETLQRSGDPTALTQGKPRPVTPTSGRIGMNQS